MEELASDAGKRVVMEGFRRSFCSYISWIERLERAELERAERERAELERAERERAERERAEVVESLRAELLNDPHTLVQLPCIRKRLYKMSFTAMIKLEYSTAWFFHRLHEEGMDEVNTFRGLCREILDNGKPPSVAQWKFLQRCVKDTTYYYLVGLDKLLAKVSQDSDGLYNLFREVSPLCLQLSSVFSYDLPSSDLESDRACEESTSNAMVVAALVVLLFCVCQFLMLFVDRGRGSRSYSSGSLDFRDVYVSIVLFRGAYVWIKFRQAATSQSSLKRKSCEAQDGGPGVYCRAVKNTSGTITHYKWEPRFKPRREKLESGATLQFRRLSLGEYDTPGEAKIVLQIAAFYYGAKDACDWVALEDGSFFVIPAMDEHEKRLTGLSKAKWVTDRAKKLFKELHPESGVKSRKQSRTSTAAAGLDVADPVGSGPHEPTPAPELWGAQHNVPEMENDSPEPYHHGNSSGHDCEATMSASAELMLDELGFDSADISSQAQSIPGLRTISETLGDASPPQSDNGAAQAEFVGILNFNCAQGVESLGAVHDNCTVTNVCEPVKEGDLQPLVSRQKTLLKEYAIRNADLEHKLLEAEVKNSELQRVIEHLRAAKAQEAAAAKSQVGTWLADFVIDFPSENGR